MTMQKWGALASFLLVMAFVVAPWIYLTGNLRDAFGAVTYDLADLLYGPVWAASLVTVVYALREHIGERAPRRMSLALLAAVLAAEAMVLVACIRSSNRHYHIMHPIRNALLLDGLGGAPFYGDLAGAGGRIAEIGGDLDGGRATLDAEGLALMPGIIDNHTHYDAQLTWDPCASPSPALGVTTAIIGNCGFTIAPCRPADRELVMRNLTHVEGMPLEALEAGVDWKFETYPEYLAMLERKGMVPNVSSFVGHSSVRTYVLGPDASKRAATHAEVAQMKRIVGEALAAGAAGFATSTLEQHNGENGVPMPSRLADEHEMRELTGALGEAGKGVFMLARVPPPPLRLRGSRLS